MRTQPRAGALNQHRHIRLSRRVAQRADILAPALTVKIDRNQPARLVLQQRRADPNRLTTLKMRTHLRRRERHESAWAHAAHFTFGLKHRPAAHSLEHFGAQPDLPGVRVLCHRVANTSSCPLNNHANSSTRPNALVMSGPPCPATTTHPRAQSGTLDVQLHMTSARFPKINVCRDNHVGHRPRTPDRTAGQTPLETDEPS